MVLGFFAILVINLLLACRNKQSKLILIITGIYFIFIFSGNSSSGDIPNYLVNYQNPDFMIAASPISAVFYYMMKVAKKIGLNFFQYKIIIGTLIYLLYFNFLKKFDVNIHYVVFFYCFHLFFFDVEQIRNALALAIYLQGVASLFNAENNKIQKYIIYTLLASTIHISFALYLLFLLYYFTWSKLFRQVLVASVLGFCIIIFMNGNNIPFIGIILNSFDIGGKVSAYFGNHMHFGFLIPFGLQFITFFAIFLFRNACHRYKIENAVTEVVYKIVLMSFLFLPLYMLSITFARFERNLIILIFLAASSINKMAPRGHVIKYKVCLTVLILVFTWGTYDILFRPDDILIPVMKYNYFINGGIYYY